MNEPDRKARAALAGALALALLAAAALIASPALWARALRASMFDSALALGTALLLGLPLGFLAGSGAKFAETTLGRGIELSASLPTALLATVALGTTQRFYAVALALGLVRALEVAWLLRWRLARARERLHLEAQSEVRLPFSVYYRRVVPGALGPALASVALTPAWLAAIDAAAVLLSLHPLSERVSVGAAAARGEPWAIPMVLVLTLALYAVARYCAARLHAEDEGHEPLPLALALRRRAPGSDASPDSGPARDSGEP